MANSINHEEGIEKVKHDVRNQLSNIALAVEQLKYEIKDSAGDTGFYIDIINKGCTRINELLNNIN